MVRIDRLLQRRHHPQQLRAALCFGVVAVGTLPSASVEACTIRADQPDSLYTALAAQSEYSGVGKVYEYVSGTARWCGSGTLLSPQWMLTCAHLTNEAVLADDMRFIINGTTYTSDYYSYHPNYNSSIADGDIALVHLSSAVTGVAYATLYTGTTSGLLGQTATYVGYGCTGTGETGYSSGTYGTKRAMQNVLDFTANRYYNSLYDFWSNRLILSDFDNPNSSTALDLEGCVAPGDSGGGVFATLNGVTYLVGVNDIVMYTDGTFDSSYGDKSGCASVCEYADWISTTMNTVPEPSSICILLATAVVLGVWRLWRR